MQRVIFGWSIKTIYTILINLTHSLTKYMFNLFSSDCMFCTNFGLYDSHVIQVFSKQYLSGPQSTQLYIFMAQKAINLSSCVFSLSRTIKKVQNHLPSEELWRIFRLKNNNLGTKMQCNLEKYHPSCTRYPLDLNF